MSRRDAGTGGQGCPPYPRKNLRRLILCGIGLAVAVGGALCLTPFPRSLENPLPPSTRFVDKNGRPLRIMLAEERRYSRPCPLAEVSPALVAATLAAEDGRFYWHPGIDPGALGRAVIRAITGKRPASGASTITQQLLKLGEPGPRTLSRKLAEMWLALRVEIAWGKDHILEQYLNRLDYGNLRVGIGAASRYYFGKPPSDLTPAEAAFLAGLPKAPTRLNPHIDPAPALERQRWILGRMRSTGRLSPAEHARAVAEPLRLLPPAREFEAPHFVDLLLQRHGIRPSGDGLVRTTLDLDLNRFVQSNIAEQLRRIADKHATGGAAVVIHNPTGQVIALAGSGDYFQPGAGQVNGAWIVRSPGSAVKPFAYLLALENGANPCSVVADVPTDFPTGTGLYRPNNYNHRFYGPVSLRFALGNSLNVAAIRALQIGGGPEALHRRLRELGITTLGHPPDWYGLGITLGNAEVRLLELSNAFATLARLGVHRPYRLLARPADAGDDPPNRTCDPSAAWLIADMLADNAARAASFGLNSYLRFDFPVASKTGTSSDYRDNWAVGFTPEFTVGVWVGNPDGSPMRGITGVTGAAPIMHDVFVELRRRFGTTWFERPDAILDVRVHPLSGRATTSDRAGAVAEKCLWEPEPEQPSDYDGQGRLLLPDEYRPWIESDQNGLGDLVACAPAAGAFRILQPVPGTIYYLDPDLPSDSQTVALLAEGGHEVRWDCATMPLRDDGRGVRAALREGFHRIGAQDPASGAKVATWIEVRAL